MSPLARYIASVYSDENNYSRMAARAMSTKGVYVTPETIRKAADDRYKTPLRDLAVEQLAAALGVDEDDIRDLDEQRWRKRPGDRRTLSEADVLAWLKQQLPGHFGEHIIAQYRILLEASRAGPPDPSEGRTAPRPAPAASRSRKAGSRPSDRAPHETEHPNDPVLTTKT